MDPPGGAMLRIRQDRGRTLKGEDGYDARKAVLANCVFYQVCPINSSAVMILKRAEAFLI